MRRFLLIAVVWLLAVLVLAGGLAVYLLHDEPFLKRQEKKGGGRPQGLIENSRARLMAEREGFEPSVPL